VVPTAVPTHPPKAAATPPPSNAPSPSAPSGKNGTYVVQSGDTLFSIARRHDVPVQTLASMNNIADSSLVKVGEQIKVPPS
jgi:LysM repeat protein